MLLVTDFDRRFSVESPGAVRDVGSGEEKVFPFRDKLTAREALRAASEAGPGALILVDGHPVQAEQLEPLASRRVSIAALTTTPNPQIENELADAKEKRDHVDQLTMSFPGEQPCTL